jgi:phosphate-selective porin OprO and OprP
MHRSATLAGLMLGVLARTAFAYDAEDWPTHYRFDDGTDIGIGANYEGDLNTFDGTSDLTAAQRATLEDAHGARREELSVYIRKPGVYEAQWGWDYWNKTYVDVYARVDSKAFAGTDIGRFRVGYFKTYVGFEGYTRTRNDTFLETALPISAFYEGRRTGASWEFEQPVFRIDLAAYAGQDLQGDNDGTTVTGRFAWTPFKQPGDVLHLGITASDESPEDSTINGNGQTVIPSIRVRTRPDVFLTSARFVDTGTLTNVDHIGRRGLEGVWIRGPWSLQGEYLEEDIHRTAGKPTFSGSGAYLFGSWVVTGESRIYDSGQVSNLKPTRSWGAVELLARYDEVDLTDASAHVHGGKEHNWTIGATWYILTHFRVQANYIWAHEAGNPVYNGGRPIDPRIFALRFQIVI